MADRLINEDAVLAAIDERIASVHRLYTNPLTKPGDKRSLSAVACTMQRLQDEVRALPSEEYTETDLSRMFGASVALENVS